MIIYTTNGVKTYECRSDMPASDWTGRAEHIIDETNPQNAELLDKVRRYAPYFEMVTNSAGEIYDIVKTADKPHTQTSEYPEMSIEEKIAQLEYQIAQLQNLMTSGAEVTS